MADAIRIFWNDVSTKWYEKELLAKPEDEANEFRERRVKWYGNVCVSGIWTLFWGSTLSALKKLKVEHPDPVDTYPCVVFFLLCFLFMGLGASAAYLPKSTPGHPVEITGIGALVAVLCALGCFHLATYELHPPPQAPFAISSMGISSIIVMIYWALYAQDPWILHIFIKLLWCTICGIWRLVWWTVCGLWNVLRSAACGLWNVLRSAACGLWNVLRSAACWLWELLASIWTWASGARGGYRQL